MDIRAIIPAAGKGSRLLLGEHDAPKAMCICGGRPLLETVLDSINFITPNDTYIVVGHKKEAITSHFGDAYHYVTQSQQLGTGHAVMMCEDHFRDFDGAVLVTFGDMPMFRKEDLQAMCAQHIQRGADCTLMTAENPDLTFWARIIRDDSGKFAAIVEGKDCTPEQAQIKELFSGVLVFNSRPLFQLLPLLRPENAWHEYYLTEIPELMVARGMKVDTFHINDGQSLRGVNTPEDLVICNELLSRRNTQTV